MKIDSESWAPNVECCWLLVDLNFWSKSFSCTETTACFVVFLIFFMSGDVLHNDGVCQWMPFRSNYGDATYYSDKPRAS